MMCNASNALNALDNVEILADNRYIAVKGDFAKDINILSKIHQSYS